MAAEVTYDHVIQQAMNLPIVDQLRLIRDLAATLSSSQLRNQGPHQKTSADFYGDMRGVRFDEADFEAAQWHPTRKDLLDD